MTKNINKIHLQRTQDQTENVIYISFAKWRTEIAREEAGRLFKMHEQNRKRASERNERKRLNDKYILDTSNRF